MHIAKLIKLVALLIQVPLLVAAYKTRKESIKNIRLKKIKKRTFILLKKIYNFNCIGVFPLINRIGDFYIGIYHNHKIGMFDYGFASILGSFNTTIIMVILDKPMPKFLLRPKNLNYDLFGWLHKRKRVFVNFEQNYILLANDCDRFKVAGLFNWEVLEYLSMHPYLWIESDGRNLMVFNDKQYLFDGSKLKQMFDRAIFLKEILEITTEIKYHSIQEELLSSAKTMSKDLP